MNTKRITALEGYDRFKTECSFFLLENEYPGWTGEEKYGIITSLTEEELLARYPAIMEALSPYILLGKDYAEVRKESRYNDDKFRYRRNNCDIPFDVDDDAACHHDELTEDDFTRRLSDKEDLEKGARMPYGSAAQPCPEVLLCRSDLKGDRRERRRRQSQVCLESIQAAIKK